MRILAILRAFWVKIGLLDTRDGRTDRQTDKNIAGIVFPVAENPNAQKISAQNTQKYPFLANFYQKNSNSRQNLGPGTKSDFIFELSGVDLGGSPKVAGQLSGIFEKWSLMS